MTCVEKLREMYPAWSDRKIRYTVQYDCPASFGIMNDGGKCPKGFKSMCYECWNRVVPGTEDEAKKTDPVIEEFAAALDEVMKESKAEDIVETRPEIPWEFEYVSTIVVEDEGRLVEQSERIWAHILQSWDKHRYTGKPCYKIRFEQERGGMWEGWCTEEEVREILEKRVGE